MQTKGKPGPKPKPLAERFWPKVDVRGPDECWPWLASLNTGGYGQLWPGDHHKRPVSAPLLSYEMAYGPVPVGLEVDHVCHDPLVCEGGVACPHRLCVNPAHLRAVTHLVNTLRATSPIARNARMTHCKRGHPFDLLVPSGKQGLTRRCSICVTLRRAGLHKVDGAA
jgi:hypothetical protein